MTQIIKVAGPSPDFASLSAAIASLTPAVPFTEPVIIQVYSTAPTEAITIPASLLPTPANPLVIKSLGTPFVPSLFPDQELDSGSHSLYPAPQPRLVPAVMGFLDIQPNNVTIDCLQVTGDVVVSGNTGIVVNGIRMVGGQLRMVRGSSTPVDVLLANCEVKRCHAQSAIRIVNVNGVKIYHNTALIRQSDQSIVGNPIYALEVVDSQVDIRNNILAASGVNAFALRFRGDPTASHSEHNIYFGFDSAILFRFGLGPETDTSVMSSWATFMATDDGSLNEDPEFRERTDVTGADLAISDTCPEMAAAPHLPSVISDIRGQRRPFDFVTMGAYENAEVITDSGKRRFLELLSGLSTQPVTKAVLGHSGVATLFQDFPAQFATDSNMDELFTPIDIVDGIVVPAPVGHEGLIVYRPQFQVTEPIYHELLDPIFDRADEVALVSQDNVIFMIKRMHSIPFDAVAFMSAQFQIPIEIVAA